MEGIKTIVTESYEFDYGDELKLRALFGNLGLSGDYAMFKWNSFKSKPSSKGVGDSIEILMEEFEHVLINMTLNIERNQ